MAIQATWDGSDFNAIFGVVIENGLKALTKMPTRKASVKNDWPDEQGVDIDLGAPTFEARQFTLTCTLVATSLADFHAKNDGFFTALSGPGVHELYVTDHDRTYLLYYVDQQNYKGLTRSLAGDKVGTSFDLILAETNPADNIPKVYLVDDEGRYLTA